MTTLPLTTRTYMRYLLLTTMLCAAASTTADAQYALRFGDAVAISGDQVLAGEGRNLLLPGTVFAFDHQDGTQWTHSATLTPTSAPNIALGFGRTLAATPQMLAVGAPKEGAVHVYVRDHEDMWVLQEVMQSDAPSFGIVLALSDNHLLVVSAGNEDQPGAVHSYRITDGSTQGTGTLAMDEGVRLRQSALALDGDVAVLGIPQSETRKGSALALTFDPDEQSWIVNGRLAMPEGADGDVFGTAVALRGRLMAIGAPGAGASGKVMLFAQNDQGQWLPDTHLMPAEGAESEDFGAALAMAASGLWVGAPGKDAGTGTAYYFSDPNGSQPPLEVRPERLQFRSRYGSRLAAHGRLAVIGAQGHDNFEGVAFPASHSEDGWALHEPVFHDAEFASVTGEQVSCEDGEAAAFPCSEVDMVSFLTRREIGARRGIQVNDVWGWEDPVTGREYALVGRTDGTSFIDLTEPSNPRYLGDLPKTATANPSLWRDIKVYQNHAFVVADGAGAHHMQVFDLTQLRGLTGDEPVTFAETALYKGVYSSHNLIINEETGFAYAVGSSAGGETCGGALHMINIQDPVNPTFVGCFADTRTGRSGSGATHDAQCVNYMGPDADYSGREICLSSNGTALSIADVTDKENAVAISLVEYPNVAYTHQGWLTEDHRYFYLNDEGDEASNQVDATRTLIFDLADLDDPLVASEYMGPSSAIDHNLYIRGNTMYQTNYVEGLRIVDITDPVNPTEIGHFDTVPYGPNDNSPVLGAWSNYPYFKSGIIVVTSGREGVFFLKKKSIDL